MLADSQAPALAKRFANGYNLKHFQAIAFRAGESTETREERVNRLERVCAVWLLVFSAATLIACGHSAGQGHFDADGDGSENDTYEAEVHDQDRSEVDTHENVTGDPDPEPEEDVPDVESEHADTNEAESDTEEREREEHAPELVDYLALFCPWSAVCEGTHMIVPCMFLDSPSDYLLEKDKALASYSCLQQAASCNDYAKCVYGLALGEATRCVNLASGYCLDEATLVTCASDDYNIVYDKKESCRNGSVCKEWITYEATEAACVFDAELFPCTEWGNRCEGSWRVLCQSEDTAFSVFHAEGMNCADWGGTCVSLCDDDVQNCQSLGCVASAEKDCGRSSCNGTFIRSCIMSYREVPQDCRIFGADFTCANFPQPTYLTCALPEALRECPLSQDFYGGAAPLCEGQHAKFCIGGKTFDIDCAAFGGVCAEGLCVAKDGARHTEEFSDR